MFSRNMYIADTAYCKSPVNQRWYKYDDHEVYEISKSDIKVSCLRSDCEKRIGSLDIVLTK